MKNYIPFIAAAALFCGCSIEEIPSDGGTVLAAIEDDHTRSADTDGRAVHPNEEGHRIFADVLIEQMEKLKQ